MSSDPSRLRTYHSLNESRVSAAQSAPATQMKPATATTESSQTRKPTCTPSISQQPSETNVLDSVLDITCADSFEFETYPGN